MFNVTVKRQGNIVSIITGIVAQNAKEAIQKAEAQMGLKPYKAVLVEGHWQVSNWHGYEFQAARVSYPMAA